LEQSDTARAVNWEIHAKEEMIFLDDLKIGYPNYPIPLVDDDFPKMGIGVGYISYFETHSYSSKMGFVENVWDIQPQIATKR